MDKTIICGSTYFTERKSKKENERRINLFQITCDDLTGSKTKMLLLMGMV